MCPMIWLLHRHLCGFVCIRNSLFYLHLVLSIPRDMGKQGIRHNNLINTMNIMMCFQSTSSVLK
jgi:hypothetical protein